MYWYCADKMCLCSFARVCTQGKWSGELLAWHTSSEEAYFYWQGVLMKFSRLPWTVKDSFQQDNQDTMDFHPKNAHLYSICCVCLRVSELRFSRTCLLLQLFVPVCLQEAEKKKILNLNSILNLQSDVIICNSYTALPHSLNIGSIFFPLWYLHQPILQCGKLL